MSRPQELIDRLQLRPHPEGGHYAEVYRSHSAVNPLDGRPRRTALTSIYFMLQAGELSRWHRVSSDEVWCHLEGAPIELHLLDGVDRSVRTATLAGVSSTRQPQCAVHAGVWQAARSTGAYSLAACMVAPGFDFADFTLMAAGDPLRAWLASHHPALAVY